MKPPNIKYGFETGSNAIIIYTLTMILEVEIQPPPESSDIIEVQFHKQATVICCVEGVG